MHHDVVKHVSSEHCTRCHREGAGFKCPKCGQEGDHYDPDHFRSCPHGAKMRVKCKACGKAEDNCTCA